jgi:SAM-dependent methyltransferase
MIIKQKNEEYYALQNARSVSSLDNNRLEKYINTIDFQKNKDEVYTIDIGCRSHANMVRKLINLGFINSYGIDIGENTLTHWNNYSFKNNLKIADVHNGIPFDFKFDLISCSHTLEHCHDPSLVLDIIKESLTEGGFYWGQVPTSRSEDIYNHTPHYCYFESHEDHLEFIKSKGFEIVNESKDNKQSILLAKKI